jgi:hypothetical protein
MMKATPAKIIYNRELEKHSEMLKPYQHDGYQEMEYFYPDYNFNWDFNFDFDIPTVRHDGVDVEGYPPDVPSRTGTCLRSDCWWYDRYYIRNCDKNFDIDLKLTDIAFVDVSVEGPISLVRWNEKKITIVEAAVAGGFYGIRGERGLVKAQIMVSAYPAPKICYCEMEIIIPKDCGECNCDTQENVTFDETKTPSTIAPGAQVTLYLSGGCAPFEWGVTGTGYTLASGVTQGRTNVLTSANGACSVDFGANALVSISDACGDTDTKNILNTFYSWDRITFLNTTCGNAARCVCDEAYPETGQTRYGYKWAGCQTCGGGGFGCGADPPWTATNGGTGYSYTVTSLGACPDPCAVGQPALGIAYISLYKYRCP